MAKDSGATLHFVDDRYATLKACTEASGLNQKQWKFYFAEW